MHVTFLCMLRHSVMNVYMRSYSVMPGYICANDFVHVVCYLFVP